MKTQPTQPRLALIDIWRGFRPLAAVGAVLLLALALSRGLGKLFPQFAAPTAGVIPDLAARGAGPLLMAGLVIAVLGASAAASMNARRKRGVRNPREAELEADITERMQLQLPIPMAQLRAAHPHLLEKIAASFERREDHAQRWLMRPHPALNNQRPIDVIDLPDGEERVLQAFEVGPNV